MESALRQQVSDLHAHICGGLADPSRILILYALAEHAYCVTDLADYLGLPQPTTSRHLKILRERGLVSSRREGQTVMYSVADQRVIEALDLLRAVLADVLQRRSLLGRSVGDRLLPQSF